MGVDHPFEHRAHYNRDGEVCHCPWGFDEGGEHLGSVKEASKWDWIKSRPDMQSGIHDMWRKWMDQEHDLPNSGLVNDRTDKLTPWLHREFKKGRLLPYIGPGGLTGQQLRYKKDPNEQWDPDEIMDMDGAPFMVSQDNRSHEALGRKELEEMQRHLLEMQKRGKGIDLMQHTVHDLMPKIQDFTEWKKAQGREHLGEVLHQFPDGWSIRRLQNPDEVIDEGNMMGHCMREPDNRYGGEVEDAQKIFLSLRDHNNLPHVTMELEPDHWLHTETGERMDHLVHNGIWQTPQIGPNSFIGEYYGKSDAPPLPEYTQRMEQFLQPKGVTMEWGEDPEADLYRAQMGIAPEYIAAATKPLYHRWVFSPTKGVTIGTNSDDHPALVKYHQDLGGDINDTDLVHGYAYPIGNGWRLTDYEHQPVEDPYIVNQVVRRLNGEDGALRAAEGSWHAPLNFDRLHYAMPLPQD